MGSLGMPAAVVKCDATIAELHAAYRRWQDSVAPADEDATLAELGEYVLWCAPCDDYHPGPSDADRAAEAARHGYGDDDAPDTLRLHTASALAYHAEEMAGEAAAAGRVEGGWLT